MRRKKKIKILYVAKGKVGENIARATIWNKIKGKRWQNKINKNNKQSISEMWDYIKWRNIHIIEVSKGGGESLKK